MSEEISKQSFNQIKDIKNALEKEIVYDKQHSNKINDWIDDDRDFEHFYNPRVSGITIAKEIDENLDLSIATDLTAIHANNAIYIMYGGDIPVKSSYMDVAQVCNIISKVLKLGRKGIEDRNNKVSAIGRHLAVSEAKLKIPYDEKYDNNSEKEIQKRMIDNIENKKIM